METLTKYEIIKSEIYKNNESRLEKKDIIKIKQITKFYGYWFDMKTLNITINSIKYHLFKVGKIIMGKDSSGHFINVSKLYKLEIVMFKSQLASIMMNEVNHKYHEKLIQWNIK